MFVALIGRSILDAMTLYTAGQQTNVEYKTKYPFGGVETKRQAVYIEHLWFVWNSAFLNWKAIGQIVGD